LGDKESNEIPVQVESDDKSTNGLNEKLEEELENSSLQTEPQKESELSLEELKEQLSKEKEKSAGLKFQLQHTLADFQNLERKTKSEIENGINTKMDQFMIEFLRIYDDFVRAKEAFLQNNLNPESLDLIFKKIDSLLTNYNVLPIDALGEIFDPKLHEAISIVEDPTLEENTITKELRKGYISHKTVIRPTLVEISKKPKPEQMSE